MFVVWLALLFAFLENKQLRMFTQKYDMQLKENIASKHNFLSANIKLSVISTVGIQILDAGMPDGNKLNWIFRSKL